MSIWTRTFPLLLGIYALAGGLISLTGWAADVLPLADWDGDGIAIQPNASLAAFSAGVGALLLLLHKRRIAKYLGVFVALIGASTLFQHLSGINLDFLNTALMFERTWGRSGTIHPGRMGPPGSLCWTLVGAAVVLAAGGEKWRRFVPPIAVLTFAITSLSILGYLYGADTLFSLPNLTVIALQTSTFAAAASLAILGAVPERAPARWLRDMGTTGTIARIAIPVIVLVPVMFGWLRLLGENAELYDTRFGVAILSFALIAMLMTLLSWGLATLARGEADLRRSERFIADILGSISDGFVAVDRGWRYTYVNAKAADLMGRPREEILGMKVWEVFPEAMSGVAFPEMRRAAAERVTVQFEGFNAALQRWFATKVYPTTDGGISVHFQDITERHDILKQQESNLAALNRLQLVSTQLVRSGELHYLLKQILAASADLTDTGKGNIQSYDVATGSLRILVHQGLGSAFLEYFREDACTAACGAAAREMRRVIIENVATAPEFQGNPDRDVFLAEGILAVQSTPLVSRDGRLLGMLNNHFTKPWRPSDSQLRYLDLLARMAADVIERDGTERTLRDADRRKDDFIATLAHELRGPLAPMTNALELMNRSREHPEVEQRSRDILRRQMAHMVRLVDDLLDVSRISRDKLALRPKEVRLGSIVEQAVESCLPLIEELDHHFVLEMPDGDVILNVDAARLVQILGNLLNNACKFTPPRGEITLSARREGDDVVISVADNGIGINAEHLGTVFQLFNQVDGPLERRHGGLGIGLHLVERFVRMHGGTVEAHSDGPGNGSLFIVRLPVGKEVAVDVGPAAQIETPSRVVSRRFLVVDDNVDSALSLAMLLRSQNHEVRTAHDGLAAVAAAEEYRPDVVLLDIGLPGINGYETCRRIRERRWGRSIVVIALTGWGQEEDRSRAWAAGFDHHMVKPVNYSELAALLADAGPAVTSGC